MLSYSFLFCFVFFFKQKTAYEMRISDWSSDVCSSDLSIEQNTPVHDGHGFDFQPGHHDTARWPAQIGEAEARLDGGKLIVAGRRSPREVGDGACIHPDLLGDMVEHDRRQQLACAQMP